MAREHAELCDYWRTIRKRSNVAWIKLSGIQEFQWPGLHPGYEGRVSLLAFSKENQKAKIQKGNMDKCIKGETANGPLTAFALGLRARLLRSLYSGVGRVLRAICS